ncbi:MAG TPA: protein-disulfide reductase DsbD domain-containing protein [Candidatus Saccharimonadales bacterium]|nr:protein-disulfide reductase DsbD domain-containing protein [Candidatus Saccharimonadales bacterium]
MKLSSRIYISVALLFCAATALAQGSSPAITVLPIQTPVVARGHKAPLHISLQVNKGFHVNSNKPNDELLMPTVVHLSPPEGIMIMNIQYPDGEQLALPFMGNDKLSVYSGNFAVNAEVRVPAKAALGTFRAHGEVKYQACDNRQCFPPKSVPLEFDVKVVKAAAKRKSTYTASSPHIR